MQAPRSFRELLDRYRDGERDFVDADLDQDSDNDLSGVCLDEADLSRAFVIASFRGASLRGTCFRDANVKTCDFRDADLRGADFIGAALCATSFGGANLAGTRFEGAFYHSYRLAEDEQPNW
jgi:uncharacterized protein YjbI with pentapeptide repeats